MVKCALARITAVVAGGIQRLAFLDLIAWSEIGPAMLAESDDGYNVDVGSTPGNMILFPSYAQHPRIFDRPLDSTAAGRYQQIYPTWHPLQLRLNLPDFGPESQDKSALELVRECNALAAIDNGDIHRGITLCGGEWASFPTSDAGQRKHSFDELIAAYANALAKYQGAAA
jgi:muramidase (phage lysozyme)